jgi:hypothetical protein
MLDFLQDCSAIPFFSELSLRAKQSEEYRLLEDAKVFSQLSSL